MLRMYSLVLFMLGFLVVVVMVFLFFFFLIFFFFSMNVLALV